MRNTLICNSDVTKTCLPVHQVVVHVVVHVPGVYELEFVLGRESVGSKARATPCMPPTLHIKHYIVGTLRIYSTT